MEDMTINTGGEDSRIVKSRLRSMKILFFGIQLGLMLVLISAFWVRTKGMFDEVDVQVIRILTLISVIVTTAGVLASVVVRTNIQRIMGRTESFSKALGRSLIFMMLALAACEAGAMVCVITIMLGGRETIPLTMFCVAIIASWLHFPGRGRLVATYKEGRRLYLEEQRLGA